MHSRVAWRRNYVRLVHCDLVRSATKFHRRNCLAARVTSKLTTRNSRARRHASPRPPHNLSTQRPMQLVNPHGPGRQGFGHELPMAARWKAANGRQRSPASQVSRAQRLPLSGEPSALSSVHANLPRSPSVQRRSPRARDGNGRQTEWSMRARRRDRLPIYCPFARRYRRENQTLARAKAKKKRKIKE